MKLNEERLYKTHLKSLERLYLNAANSLSVSPSSDLKSQADSLVKSMNQYRRKLKMPTLTRNELIKLTQQAKDAE